MASDLSKLIQDSFTLTLNGLLAKDAQILKITKAHPYDVEDTQFLLVQSLFNFSTFSSKFSYLVPAKSASLIFNTMMGSPITDLSDEIDDDAEDAIGEFISNASGGLTTAINGTDFEDIGQTKFNISHKELINGDDIPNLDNTFRFLIDLEDQELVLYLAFDEEILPYIEEISSSEITFHQERAPVKDEEEIIKEIEEKQEEVPLQEEIPAEEPSKEKNLKLPIMIVGGAIGVLLLVFIILYLIGFFDPKPMVVEQKDSNITKKIEKVSVIQYKTIKKVDFKISEIDKDRLNAKLQNLTKYAVLSKEELEQQEEDEKIRLQNIEKEKQLLSFAKQNIEESLEKREETNNVINQETTPQEEQSEVIEPKEEAIVTDKTKVSQSEIVENPVLHYVVTDSLKYQLFKSIVQQTTTTQARISICNNQNGKTTIYIGPFETIELQNSMIMLTQEKSADINMDIINITEKEFNLRCNL